MVSSPPATQQREHPLQMSWRGREPGVVVEDAAAANLVYARAVAAGTGTVVPV